MRPRGSRRSSARPFGTVDPRDRQPGLDLSLAARRVLLASRRGLAAIASFGRRLEPAARVIYTLPVLGAAALIAMLARVGGAVWNLLLRISAVLRPEWVVAAVALACAAAMGIAQFVHFTGVEVDSLAYQGKIGTRAPVPVTQFEDAGSAHAYVLLPVAALAALLVGISLRGNWRFGRLVALCGAIGIAVTLIVDLPKGLDAGSAGLAYNDASAELSDGFYAQLSSASMLFLAGLVLSNLLHQRQPAGDRRRRRISRPSRRSRSRDPRPARRNLISQRSV